MILRISELAVLAYLSVSQQSEVRLETPFLCFTSQLIYPMLWGCLPFLVADSTASPVRSMIQKTC